jgi:peptidoglycan/LPS O-acetylase OafA/YrhL
MVERNRDRFIALDSWRGVCALLVATHNIGCSTSKFVTHSSLFVDFFFVLSGFVITHAYMRRLTTSSDIYIFMLRRFGRLWPLHFALLLVFISIELTKVLFVHRFSMHRSPFDESNPLNTILPNLLLVQSIFMGGPTWNVPSWSISTELWTYVGFGAVCLCWPKRRPPLFVMLGVALFAAGIIVLFSPSFLETNRDYAIFRCVYGFVAGHLVYRIWESGPSRLPGAALIEILAVIVVLAFVYAVDGDAWSLAAPAIMGFAVLAFAHEGGYLSRVLRMRMFTLLGEWSYSIYMVHWLVIGLLSRTMNFMGGGAGQSSSSALEQGLGRLPVCDPTWLSDCVFLGYLLLVVGLAAITYQLIERPSRAFFYRLADRLDRPRSMGPRAPIDVPMGPSA